MITRTASARYEGFGKEGRASVSTQSGVLDGTAYGFGSRFEGEKGTNPEELIAAAHASCFTMALSFALAREGLSEGTLETTAKVQLDKEGDGFTDQPLGPQPRGRRPRHRRGPLPRHRRGGQGELPRLEAAQRRDRLRIPPQRLRPPEPARLGRTPRGSPILVTVP